jgi:maltooligosyltrehalose synthase
MSETCIENINGTFDRKALNQMTWPIAWFGQPNREYEAAVRQLVGEALEALDEDPDATHAEIINGKLVAIVAGVEHETS